MAEEDAKLDAEEEGGTQDPPKPKKKKDYIHPSNSKKRKRIWLELEKKP